METQAPSVALLASAEVTSEPHNCSEDVLKFTLLRPRARHVSRRARASDDAPRRSSSSSGSGVHWERVTSRQRVPSELRACDGHRACADLWGETTVLLLAPHGRGRQAWAVHRGAGGQCRRRCAAPGWRARCSADRWAMTRPGRSARSRSTATYARAMPRVTTCASQFAALERGSNAARKICADEGLRTAHHVRPGIGGTLLSSLPSQRQSNGWTPAGGTGRPPGCGRAAAGRGMSYAVG